MTDEKSTFKVFPNGTGGMFVTIPKALGQALAIKSGDKVEFLVFQGMLCIKKVGA